MDDRLGPTGTRGPDDSGLRDNFNQDTKKKSYTEFVIILLMFILVNLFSFFIAWHSPLDCEPTCQNETEMED